MERNDNADVAKYVLRFGLFYLLAFVVIAGVTALLKIDSNSSSMVSIFIAMMMTSLKFINDNKRVPNASEKRKLVWYSFAATWVVSFVLVVLFLSIAGELGTIIKLFNELGLALLYKLPLIPREVGATLELFHRIGFSFLFGAVLFVSALEVLMLYFGYGWYAKKQYEGLVKKGKI